MTRKTPLAVLFTLPLAFMIGACVTDTDDDGDVDADDCRTECDDARASCALDCDDADNSCVLACDADQSDCSTDCD
ncbi:MAG TPA: hypothetical protein VJU61_29265 [Polyangiaceae bacterium]|nr:hypothetical protein [Polyangiaceae bacterium]